MKKFKFPKAEDIMNLADLYDMLAKIYQVFHKGSDNWCEIDTKCMIYKKRRMFTVVCIESDIMSAVYISKIDDSMYFKLSSGTHWGNLVTMFTSDTEPTLNLRYMRYKLSNHTDVYDHFMKVIETVKGVSI